MLSERLYRALLWIYPKEHRQEYGELMVQLFRDRMRYDGRDFGGLVVWMQTLSDLAVSAFDEHRKGENMKKRMLIAVVSIVALLTVSVGVSVVMSQSEDKAAVKVSVWQASSAYHGEGDNALADALRQAVEDGAIAQESADDIEVSFVELRSGATPPLHARHNPPTFSVSLEGESGLADALAQAVEEGVISQDTADLILENSMRIIYP